MTVRVLTVHQLDRSQGQGNTNKKNEKLKIITLICAIVLNPVKDIIII